MEWTSAASLSFRLGKKAYDERHLIQKFWTHLKAHYDFGRTEIGVTGHANAGKTILTDQLHGKASEIFYEIPKESTTVEVNSIKLGEWHKLVRVLPGQDGYRATGAVEVFQKNEDLNGIIHLVDFGYNKPRDPTIIKSMIEIDGIESIEKLRELNLNHEMRVLESLLTDLDRSITSNKTPKWLIFAVNKCDLFPNSLDDALSYYHPDGAGRYGKRVAEFISQIGKRSIPTFVVKSCAREENFEWNGVNLESSLEINERSDILKNLFELVATVSNSYSS